MARHRERMEDAEELPAQDSFLDLVANIVGIMILLVVIVGIRAATSAPETLDTITTGPPTLTINDLDKAVSQFQTFAQEKSSLELKTLLMEQKASELDEHRIGLIGYVNEAEQELAINRNGLDEQRQEELDLRIAIAQAESEFDDLLRERLALESGLTNTKTLRNVPTPIATKAKDTIHLWVDEGRVAIAPVEELGNLAMAHSKARGAMPKGLVSVETPQDGFIIRYTLIERSGTTAGGKVIKQIAFAGQVRPKEGHPGEPIIEACQEHSRLREKLGQLNSATTTVAIWVPSRSFADIAPLRELASKLGFSTAVWPRGENEFIQIGTGGKSSDAQ